MEELTEERIPIEKIILHERFHNFQHDIGKEFYYLVVQYVLKTLIKNIPEVIRLY